MKKNFIKNRKQQIIAVFDKWGNQIDILVIFNKKNIVIDGNKIGKRNWKSIMLEIENRYDLMEENFYHNTYFMNDEFIRKVERSISNQNLI
jgi:hypothetical protein